ncbi:hypothetical protein DD509_01575 [Dehalogenimonas alkenigignens]|uniref:Uncharacterized protein n=1 Tax=Dehalogenimonas alkenigignens TaxID=1217799 RepID=A0A0W0GJ27_9CHLR|nr:hypothetical protein DEALK_13910 [Dehalogenimonas alkenigignens]PVV85010.1 hypothetical protein DD509_01575 [Dehalogenimonas alkenigignens]
MTPVNSLRASFSGALFSDSTNYVEYRPAANFVYNSPDSYLKTGRNLGLELDPFNFYQKTLFGQSKQIAKTYRFNRFCLKFLILDRVTIKLLPRVCRK